MTIRPFYGTFRVSLGLGAAPVWPDVLFSSDRLGWPNVGVQGRLHPGGEYAYERFAAHLFSVNVGDGLEIKRAAGDLRPRDLFSSTGAVGLVPAGRPALWEHDAACRFLNVSVDARFVHSVLREEGLERSNGEVELVETLSATDPYVERLVLSLASEAQTEGLGSELYAESVANLLAIHLLRNYSALGQKDLRGITPKTSGRSTISLPNTVLERVGDYVGDNLSGNVSVQEMASLAGLSRYHFSRLFKQSTGLSPHQYVVSSRVERAKAILSNTNLPVGEVSRLCGFSHHQHLNRHFQRLVGATPKQFRQEAFR